MDLNPVVSQDFDQIAQASQTLATQLGRLRHLPVFDNGAAILAALRAVQQQQHQMQEQLQQHEQQMMQQMLDMEQRLTTRISASNTNTLARIHNSQLISPEHELMPLNNAATNLPIQGFPSNAAAITTMLLTDADKLLAALEENFEGNVAEKLQHIRYLVGLKKMAV